MTSAPVALSRLRKWFYTNGRGRDYELVVDDASWDGDPDPDPTLEARSRESARRDATNVLRPAEHYHRNVQIPDDSSPSVKTG